MLYLLYFCVTADEITKTMNMKDEVWKELKETVKALKEPKNILLLGCLGTGKSSFINTMITALTGKYDLYADVGAGTKHTTTRLHRFVQKTRSGPKLHNRKGSSEDIEYNTYFIHLLETFVFLLFSAFNTGKTKKLNRFINILHTIFSIGNIYMYYR